MTKAAQIMRLFGLGKSTREIAMQVYSLDANAPRQMVDSKMAYVRVVTRQRLGGESAADVRWRNSAHGRPIYNAKYRAMRRRRTGEAGDSTDT